MKIRPLAGFRVIDFGWVWAGPLLAGLLADMGAEVIKVESRKHMDSMRNSPDNMTRDPEKDPWFHSANRNKLSLTVDIAQPRGQAIVKELVSVSDIIVENFSPKVLPRYGLDYRALLQARPDIVMISLPATGEYGPMRDVVTYGPSLGCLSGLDGLIGYPGERVLGMQHGFPDPNSSVHGAFAVLAALRHRQRTGEGQHIDMSQMETVVTCLGEAVMGYTMNGQVMGTVGNEHPTMAPHSNYPCQGEDKWVSIAVRTEDEWQGFRRALGDPPWTREPRFADAASRLRHREDLDRHVAQWTRQHTHYEVMEMLQAAGVAAAPCLDMEERYFDPHFQERQTHLDFPHPATGVDAIAGFAFKMTDLDAEIRRPAPLLGQHNDYVFQEVLGHSAAEMARLEAEQVLC